MKNLEYQKIQINLLNIFISTLVLVFAYLSGQLLASILILFLLLVLFHMLIINVFNLKYYKSCYESLDDND